MSSKEAVIDIPFVCPVLAEHAPHRPSKPVVLYDSVFGFIEKGRSVTLHGVYNHPVLGANPYGADAERTVITTPVEEVRENGSFETRNTIYKVRALNVAG